MLTFEEYKKLNDEEKQKKYIELSDEDKFKVRTSDYIEPIHIGKVDMRKYLTEERKKEIEKSRNEINEYLDKCTYHKNSREVS